MMKSLLTQGALKTVTLDGGDITKKREDILSYLDQAIISEETLYSCITDSLGFYKRADPLRHPLIFYYGHTACFFINKLFAAGIIEERLNRNFESIFAVGVDEMSWDDLDSKHYDWPPIGEVKQYRKQVFDLVREKIQTMNFTLPITWDSQMWIILMGIEHLRIHIETSSVLIRQLSLDYLSPISYWRNAPTSGFPPVNSMLDVNGGEVTLGKPSDYPTYGWDNEYGTKQEVVSDFKASKYLCSNAEYLAFVLDRGYSSAEYWSEEGWNWVLYTRCTSPRFWSLKSNKWRLRLLFEEIEMPWDWPVEVNCLEAEAFCRWKRAKEGVDYRLPSEAEWEKLYLQCNIPDVMDMGGDFANIGLDMYQSPCPINHFEFSDFYDVIGNVWQWTRTPIDGYEGFKVHPIYDDFSVPTFDQKHNLFKGGSWISTGNEATRYARYAFRRHFYQHAGFRYVVGTVETENDSQQMIYDRDVIDKIALEWFDTSRNMERDLADLAASLFKDPQAQKVLDVGCSTGKSSFELMRHFTNVQAADRTARLIGCGVAMQTHGRIVFCDDQIKEVVLEDYFDPDYSKNGAFFQIDFMNMKPFFNDYHLIVVSNYDMQVSYEALMEQLTDRLNPSGWIVLVHQGDEDYHKTVSAIQERCINLEFVRATTSETNYPITIWRLSE
ncbi:5-histidylcysteine sulfoxide synthase [Halosquirtibacter laminarini]|uniref:5-histidylcysteine sulfoxide synthase n=1 Tax=Halosquirtibacter laminarini TaxID=3374600 RepID=A0AC61NBD1_9BACT|nr:5-histidylcysteine sulfoxide synthase [Prolixibacteraceae bacterium]